MTKLKSKRRDSPYTLKEKEPKKPFQGRVGEGKPKPPHYGVKLKKCPHCGGPIKLVHSGDNDDPEGYRYAMLNICQNCGDKYLYGLVFPDGEIR